MEIKEDTRDHTNPIIRNPHPDLLEGEAYEPNLHPAAQWFFRDAALGLFIHWGISSVSGEYDLSWAMMKRPDHAIDDWVKYWGVPSVTYDLPPREYWDCIKGFDVANYDPDRWLSAAKRAGFQYAVLTTRHHDGFALWPSRYGEFNTATHLGGRDLVGEYVRACRKNGLKVGFYYSPPDWYMEREWMNYSLDPEHPLDQDWNSVPKRYIPREEKIRVREYNRNQIEELLANYGQIDLFWFDCVYGSDCITLKRMRELQPQIVVNSRGRERGDFLSEDEQRFPEQRRDGAWDYCDTFQEGACWGYMKHESYYPAGWLLELLAKTRSWNGKFLVNVGPDSHGELPAAYYKRMAEIEEWMKSNGNSLFGTDGTPYWPEKCNVPVTQAGDILYLHVHWRVDYPVEFRDCPQPHDVTLNGRTIPYQYENGTLTFRLPQQARSLLTSVVQVLF